MQAAAGLGLCVGYNAGGMVRELAEFVVVARVITVLLVVLE